jgi:hypothetical protein
MKTKVCFVVVAVGMMFSAAIVMPTAASAQLDLPSPFHFSGSGITLANSSALAPRSQVRITAWIRPDFTVPNFVDTVIEKRDGCGSNRSYDFGVYKAQAVSGPVVIGTIFFSASLAGDDVYSTVPVPNDGNFHYIAGTYDGTAMKVFLDGVLVGQKPHTGPIATTSDPPVVGTDRCGHPAFADIDEIQFAGR